MFVVIHTKYLYIVKSHQTPHDQTFYFKFIGSYSSNYIPVQPLQKLYISNIFWILKNFSKGEITHSQWSDLPILELG